MGIRLRQICLSYSFSASRLGGGGRARRLVNSSGRSSSGVSTGAGARWSDDGISVEECARLTSSVRTKNPELTIIWTPQLASNEIDFGEHAPDVVLEPGAGHADLKKHMAGVKLLPHLDRGD